MTVTDASRYARGARDDIARAAATMSVKRHRVERARRGAPLREDAGPTRRYLLALHKKMTWDKMGTFLPITRRAILHIVYGEVQQVHYKTAEAVEALWLDVCAPMERDDRRWPIGPFKEAVLAQRGSVRALGNTNQARHIYAGGTISSRQAEDYAENLGLMPSEIWEDWYQ